MGKVKPSQPSTLLTYLPADGEWVTYSEVQQISVRRRDCVTVSLVMVSGSLTVKFNKYQSNVATV